MLVPGIFVVEVVLVVVRTFVVACPMHLLNGQMNNNR